MIWKYLFHKGNRKWLALIMMATVNFSVAYKWSAFLSYQIPSVCLYLTRWWAARKERLDYWWNNRYRTCQNEKKSCNIMVGLKISSRKKKVLCFFFQFKTASFEWKTKHFFCRNILSRDIRYHLPLSLERHQFGVYLSFR